MRALRSLWEWRSESEPYVLVWGFEDSEEDSEEGERPIMGTKFVS